MEQTKATLNVTGDVKNNIVKNIDLKKYALLDNASTDRFDLFNLALSIGLQENKQTPLSSHDSFVRTERLTEDIWSYYRAIYYDKVLAPNLRSIDEITDNNAVLELIEQYANTGFIKLAEYMETMNEESFVLKLLADAVTLYKTELVMSNSMVCEDEMEYGIEYSSV